MNEIILIGVYVILTVIAILDLLRSRKIDNKGFIKTILAVILTVGFGFYIPVHKYNWFKRPFVRSKLNTQIYN